MKAVEIIPLAQKKIAARGIPTGWVEDAVRAPEQIVEGYGGRKVFHRKYSQAGKQKLLRVIAEEFPEKFVVITAYLTSEIERYAEVSHES